MSRKSCMSVKRVVPPGCQPSPFISVLKVLLAIPGSVRLLSVSCPSVNSCACFASCPCQIESNKANENNFVFQFIHTHSVSCFLSVKPLLAYVEENESARHHVTVSQNTWISYSLTTGWMDRLHNSGGTGDGDPVVGSESNGRGAGRHDNRSWCRWQWHHRIQRVSEPHGQ